MLPEGTTLGTVTLTIADLERSLQFYENGLGFTVLSKTDSDAVLGTGSGVPLIRLTEVPGIAPRPQQGVAGIYHYAILLPSEEDLARFVYLLHEAGIPAGAGDHLVSQAFYFSDPDGIGIEVYADRPREEWQRVNGQIQMSTLEVDVQALVQKTEGKKWSGIPDGTIMGHLHFHAGNMPEAEHFFKDVLGFETVLKMGGSVHFLATDGYHHHIGLNTWARGQSSEEFAALVEWELLLPDEASKEPIRQRAGVQGDYIVGPDGIGVTLTVRPSVSS